MLSQARRTGSGRVIISSNPPATPPRRYTAGDTVGELGTSPGLCAINRNTKQPLLPIGRRDSLRNLICTIIALAEHHPARSAGRDSSSTQPNTALILERVADPSSLLLVHRRPDGGPVRAGAEGGALHAKLHASHAQLRFQVAHRVAGDQPQPGAQSAMDPVSAERDLVISLRPPDQRAAPRLTRPLRREGRQPRAANLYCPRRPLEDRHKASLKHAPEALQGCVRMVRRRGGARMGCSSHRAAPSSRSSSRSSEEWRSRPETRRGLPQFRGVAQAARDAPGAPWTNLSRSRGTTRP